MKTRTVTDYEYDSVGRVKRTVSIETVIFPGDDDGDEEPVLERARRLAPTHPVFYPRTAGQVFKTDPKGAMLMNVIDQTPDNVIQLDDYR